MSIDRSPGSIAEKASDQDQPKDPSKRRFIKNIAMLVGGVGAAAAGASALFPNQVHQLAGCANPIMEARFYNESRLRTVVLSYVSNPNFVTDDMLEQLTGCPAELERWYTDIGKLLISVPDGIEQDPEMMARLANDPSLLQIPESDQYGAESFTIGEREMRYRARGRRIIIMDEDNLRVDPESSISLEFPESDAVYNLPVQEMADIIDERTTYAGSGNHQFVVGRSYRGTPTVSANHGRYVSMPGTEPSLVSLVEQLTEGLTTNEEKAQALLDFVYSSVTYNWREAMGRSETLKRASETLMSATTDCSGRAILYASLLEQAGINYIMLYPEGHISIAVEGDYRGGVRYEYEDRVYTLAEPTSRARRFIIGQTELSEVDQPQFLQIPSTGDIIDISTGQPAQFFDPTRSF